MFDTEYDRASVPPYNGNDPPPAPGSLKRSLFPTLLNEVQNKGTQGVRARYDAELPPIISIVRCPGRPVISVPEMFDYFGRIILRKLEKAVAVSGVCAGVLEESSGKFQENCWNFPESPNALILGFRAPEKANLPQTLGPHCSGPCTDLPCGVFFEIDIYSLLKSFSVQ